MKVLTTKELQKKELLENAIKHIKVNFAKTTSQTTKNLLKADYKKKQKALSLLMGEWYESNFNLSGYPNRTKYLLRGCSAIDYNVVNDLCNNLKNMVKLSR